MSNPTEENDTLDEFLEGVEFDLMPIYVMMAAIVAWLGIVTVMVLRMDGASHADAQLIGWGAKALIWMLILSPLLPGVKNVVKSRWNDG